MHPFLFTIAGFRFPAYGFMVAAGYLAAVIYLYRKRASGALTRNHVADLIFYSAIAGILGAKTVFAATYWKDLGPDFYSRALFVFRSFPYGFVFYGGLAAGTAAFIYYCRRRGLDFLRAADYFAPSLPLAHSFGRLGCFLAGCCHGRPSGGWTGVVFSDPLCEVSPVYLGVPLHPTQLYEAAANFLIFLGLHSLGRRKAGLRRGTMFAAYLASYSVLRFSVEFLRGDDRGGFWFGLSPAQLFSVVFGFTAAFIFIASRNHAAP